MWQVSALLSNFIHYLQLFFSQCGISESQTTNTAQEFFTSLHPLRAERSNLRYNPTYNRPRENNAHPTGQMKPSGAMGKSDSSFKLGL